MENESNLIDLALGQREHEENYTMSVGESQRDWTKSVKNKDAEYKTLSF